MDENKKPFFVTLPDRGILRVGGEDRFDFLQGLISNDVNFLKSQPCVYSCLLTPQGKFLHDFFMTQDGEEILLETEGGARVKDLHQRLFMYKMRAKVTFEVIDKLPIYAIIGDNTKGINDPRHDEIGSRSFEKPDNIEERPLEEWDTHRIKLCIPDGSRDMVPEFSTMLESRIDTLNGVCFDKGCFIGQELTARMNYRGLAKKHLYTVSTNLEDGFFHLGAPLPAAREQLHLNGKTIGEMRSSSGGLGIALLKDERIHKN